MVVSQRQILLKDGTACLLRSPGPEDAGRLLQYLKQICGETDNLTRYPEELTQTEEQERRFIQTMADSRRDAMIAAFVQERLIGNVSLNPVGEAEKLRHRATVGLGVLQKYWGLGLGKRLLETVLALAPSLGYEQVELEVLSSNHRGLALYRRMGFEERGRTPQAFRLRDGGYEDETLMFYRCPPPADPEKSLPADKPL